MGIAVVIALLAIIILMFFYWRTESRQTQKPFNKSEIEACVAQWKGWIEVCNSEFKPIFQGKALGQADGWEGLLLVGVLIEDNIPAPLAQALKRRNPACTSEGQFLVRCLSAHDKDFIMSGIEPPERITMLESLLVAPDKIESRMVLNSEYLDAIDIPEGILQFDTIWQNSSKQAAG
ncbi:hypothetical protein [Agarivorans sp. QJM3NY_33]|uniref:hypothetical protein n=1 Tax=Agarivorans sp. QJM3NY_33 TaxID=3421432 RepID=UPI003D7D99AD